jgi:carboxymethylenebutenolidase
VAGFCIGGGFALLYAAGAGVQAVAPFYPAVPDDEALAGICPVVASFGGRDTVFGGGGEPLRAALERLGVPNDVQTYPDAGHGFMARYDGPLGWLSARLPTHVAHDPDAAADAWRRTIEFFARHLGGVTAPGIAAETTA